MKTTFTFSRSQQAFLVTYKIETFNENSMKNTFTMQEVNKLSYLVFIPIFDLI